MYIYKYVYIYIERERERERERDCTLYKHRSEHLCEHLHEHLLGHLHERLYTNISTKTFRLIAPPHGIPVTWPDVARHASVAVLVYHSDVRKGARKGVALSFRYKI